jgi:hypothetical protein
MTTTTGADVLVHDIGEEGTLAIRLPAGSVELHGIDGTTTTVRDLDGHSLDDRFVVDRRPDRLDLRPRDRASLGLAFLRGDHGRARLRLDVPRRAAVSVESASAGIEAEGIEREQRYRTASGSIRVTGAGTLTLDSVSGDVRVDARGAIDLAGRVVSGEVEVHGGQLRSAVITTTSGDVLLDAELTGHGPYSIQSVSGDARVRASGSLRVEVQTLTGQIEGAVAAAFGGRGRRGRGDFVLGDGRHLLTFKSVSGDLRISDAGPGSGAPASHGAPEPPAPPAPPSPGGPPPPPDEPATGQRDDDRLAILRDLEEGRIGIDEASERLAALEERDDV